MKFEECKIGDIVTPKTNEIKAHNPYLCYSAISYTTWTKEEFIIIGLNYGTKTVDITPRSPEGTIEYGFVDPSCLNPVNFHEFPISDVLNSEPITSPQTPTEQSVDFKVVSSSSQLSAYYKGRKIAIVDHNNYDEEFELNLLLRRACLKLKDKHTMVKTVEELLQKP